MAKKKISLTEIFGLIGSGYTRYKKDNTSERGFKGSIQEFYDLNGKETQKLFKNERFKSLRINPPKEDSFELIDDIDSESTVSVERNPEEIINNTIEREIPVYETLPIVEDLTMVRETVLFD